MNKFQSLCLGATLAASTMTVVSIAPAQAITLNGTVSIDGAATLGIQGDPNPVSSAINWTTGTGTVLQNATGDFTSFNSGSPKTVNLKNLALDLVPGSVTGGSGITQALYTFAGLESFIEFGSFTKGTTTANLSFDLNAGSLTRFEYPTGIVEVSLDGISGTFIFDEETVATGFLTGTQTFNLITGESSGGVVISLTAVPEPLTVGGIALGASFGAFLRKRYSKKGEKLAKA